MIYSNRMETYEVDHFEKSTEVPHSEELLWTSRYALEHYESFRYIVCQKGKETVGLWVIPTSVNDRNRCMRAIRLFPYVTPWIQEGIESRKRKIAMCMFSYIQEHASLLSLPMDPSFLVGSGLQQMGAWLEWRHTHILEAEWLQKAWSGGKLTNRLKRARSRTTLSIHNDASAFDFRRALVGQTNVQVKNRQDLACALVSDGFGFIVDANIGCIVGQVLVVLWGNVGYLFHAWSGANYREPGVAAFLISSALERVLELGGKHLDLEGSVIAGVDEFFFGLKGKVTPYCAVHWSQYGMEGLLSLFPDNAVNQT